MRVLYFSTDYGPHDHRFLSALAKTAHNVHFLRLARSERQTEDRPVPAEVEQLTWAGGKNAFRWRDVPKLLQDLRRVIRDVQPDLIHAGPIQTCAFLATLSGFKPVLSMSWGFDLMQDADRDPWWRWVTRYTLRRSSFFVSDARVTRAKAVSLGMRAERTAVFPWGVDLQHFSPGAAARSRARRIPRKGAPKRRAARAPKATEKPFIVFCNRSWEPRYGVDVLARAFVQAARQHDGLSLMLLGAGSQVNSIRQFLLEGGQMDRVQFGGQVTQAELPRWYQMADLFVSASHVDGSSVSLMEALACGTPVLVSDIPANKEWVRDNVDGWLFRDGDVAGLAEKILWISTHRSALRRISASARKVAEERADWQRNFQVLLRSYDKAVKLS
ncbi:MAG: glycosyltransferase family 4 protein [Chloroflexota bacterium]